jgi:hypothetical protein
MIDEKNVQVAPQPAQSNPQDEDALQGKIARFPSDIREELNQRLDNGQRGPEILPWLNELPAVKQVLAAHFNGAPVNAENLSNWRHGGHQRWLRQRRGFNDLKEYQEYALQINKTDNGNLAPAAAAAASHKILEFLNETEPGQITPDELVKCAAVAAHLAKTEQNNTRIKIANERLRQHEMLILLKRDQNQRDAVAIAMRALSDDRAKRIEASSLSNHEKIELLGIHLFDDLWEPRPIPTPEDYAPPNQTNNEFTTVGTSPSTAITTLENP